MATQTETITKSTLHTTGVEDLSFPDLPPFPDDVLTAPLHRLSLSALRTSPDESARLFDASKELGFFYLDLRSDSAGEELLRESGELFELAPELFGLGREELSQFDYSDRGSYFGYKGFGKAVVDEKGNLDRNEFYNIPKDDFLEQSQNPFSHPSLLTSHKPLLQSYIRHSHALITFLLTHLESHLQLPPSTLTSLHHLEAISGDHVRFIKAPPQPESDKRVALGKHTDFGSLTILFNRLGGLQILPPPSLLSPRTNGHGNGKEMEWMYVRPLKGHCIINLGDAMTKFTRGLLRSNIHRVVSPPGQQGEFTRWSLVYFARPEDQVLLRGLEGGVIPAKRGEGGEEEAMTAKEWIKLQALRLRKKQVGEMDERERRMLWEESERGI